MNAPVSRGRSGGGPEARPGRVPDLRPEAERQEELRRPPAVDVQCAERRLSVQAADPQVTGQRPVEAGLPEVTLTAQPAQVLLHERTP